MKKLTLSVFLLAFGFLVNAQVPVVKWDAINKLINQKQGPVQVINFWATWCGPCVKELPQFETVHLNDNAVTVTLVSLDYADKIDKVESFLTRKNMKSSVILLDEIDYNSWIDKVDPSWEGAIPATLVYNPQTGKRIFVQHELKDGELEKLIATVK
ncbi:MAG: TlpA family protein disulfide reductase [Chryseotalea sp.]|jgi:thiol-disulfide isomerase/thioredoxin